MGSCYSQQAQIHRKYSTPQEQSSNSGSPSSMPHPTESGPTDSRPEPAHNNPRFGFKKPYGGRYNNKAKRSDSRESNRDDDGTAVGTMTSAEHGGRKGNTGAGKYGFKNMGRKTSDGQRRGNGLATSSDSINSTSSVDRERATRSLPSSKPSSIRRAYMPRSNTGSWKMIDDTSSAFSSRSGDKSNSRSRTATPLGTDDISNGNAGASTTPVSANTISASADTTPVRILPLIKAPIAIVESLETLPGGSRADTPSREETHPPRINNTSSSGDTSHGKFQSRLKGPFKKSNSATTKGQGRGSQPAKGQGRGDKPESCNGNRPLKVTSEHPRSKGSSVGRNNNSAGDSPNSAQKRNNSAGKSNNNTGRSNGSGFLRGFLHRPKSVPGPDLPNVKDSTPRTDQSNNIVNKSKPEKSRKKSVKSGVDVGEVIQTKTQETTHRTPSVSLDALETTSIGSIHSDDLMLDVDLDEYEELGHPLTAVPSGERSKPTRTHSRSRSGSRSRSRDNAERRPSGGGVDKCGERSMSVGSDSGIPGPPRKQPHVEPILELASLVEASHVTSTAQRRQQRLQRATRPASFPGPRAENNTSGEAGHGGSTTFKPPRQGSLHADEEMITIDSFTYRHLVQDVTAFKTLLLKLKRQIQEDEFHSKNFKNGFKLSGSQPNSPYEETNKFVNFAASFEQDDYVQHVQLGANGDDVIRENAELKQQLHSLNHQVEEQERTIKLLQQQMTKYECGYSEPGGKAYTHVSTQTDKQTSGFYKAGSYRSACVRRTSSTSSQPPSRHSNRPELRAKASSSITDEVFMDNESCDIEDDLDLLMEDVSLGSGCYSSVDDNFSRGESFRAALVTSATPSHRDNLLSNHERENSFTNRDKASLLLSHGRDNSMSQHGRDTSLSHGKGESLSVDHKNNLCRQESSSSQQGRPTTLNLNISEVNGLDNTLPANHKLRHNQDHSDSQDHSDQDRDLHTHDNKCDLHKDGYDLNLHVGEPVLDNCDSPTSSVDRRKRNGRTTSESSSVDEIKTKQRLSQSSASDSLDLSSYNMAGESLNSSSSRKNTGDSDIAADVSEERNELRTQPSLASAELQLKTENISSRLPDSRRQSQSPEGRSFSPQSPGDRRFSPYCRQDGPHSPVNHSVHSPPHSLHSAHSYPSHSPGDGTVSQHSIDGSTRQLVPESRPRSRSPRDNQSRSRSPRDNQSELDNVHNESIASTFHDPRHSNENNNFIFKKPLSGSSNMRQKAHIVGRQDHFEPGECMEIIPAEEVHRAEKKPTKGLRLPSGRIANLGNPERPSRLPPPRPSQLPVKGISVPHSRDQETNKADLGKKSTIKSFQAPPREQNSVDKRTSQESQDRKKRRQLPSLASVQQSDYSGHVTSGRSSAGSIGSRQLRYAGDPTSRRNTRGKAK